MNTVITKPDFEEVEATLSAMENDWKLREEGLQTLLKNLAHTTHQRQTFDRVTALAKPIALQHSDLRSAIVKLASEVVQEAASLTRKYKNLKLQRFSEGFLKEASFIKALGSGNKVIAKHAQSAIQALSLHNCVGFEALCQFYASCKAHKIIAVRERVAEAVLAFMKNVIHPPKAAAINLFSGHDVCENLNSSGFLPEEQSLLVEKPTNRNITSKIGGLSRPRTSRKPKPLGIKAQKAKVENPEQDDQRERKLALEDLVLFKEAAEVFLKDAAAPVRANGKEIKKELAKLEEALVAITDDKDSDMSTETAEEYEYRQRFVSHERLNLSLRPRLQSKGSSINLGIGLVKPQSKNSFLIEHTLIKKPLIEKKEVSKPNFGFVQKSRKPLAEEILAVLADLKILAKEKAEEVARLVAVDGCKIPEFSLEQYLELIRFADTAKSVPFKDVLVKLLTAADISEFKEELFEKLLAKRLLRKVTLSAVVNYVMNQLGLIFLVKAFISHRSEEIAGLLDRNLAIEDLDALAGQPGDLAGQYLHRITKNVELCTTNPDLGAKFESENFSLFEKAMQNQKMALICANFGFEPFFLEWLRRTNPSLHKSLLVSQQNNGVQSIRPSMFNMQKELN